MLDSSMTLDNQHTALGLLSQTSDKQGGLWVPTNNQTPRPHLSLKESELLGSLPRNVHL